MQKCLIDSEEDFNIFKTHGIKIKNIDPKSNKNKEDIIKQLSKKIGLTEPAKKPTKDSHLNLKVKYSN